MIDFRGALIVVTGASSGIGLARARLLARKGARVVLMARRAERLAAAAREIIASGGGDAHDYAVDLSDASQVETACNRIQTDLGTPDVLINNAGAGRWLPLTETSPDEARRMIEVPYLAAFYKTRMFLPEMLARGSGRVACITSPASHIVWPNACGYIAARHALKGFTEALRAETRGTGVGVTLVTLGTVKSSYWEHNPGSREHLPSSIPWLMPELTTEDAAETIVTAIRHERARVVRPSVYRVLFAFGLNA